MRHNWRVLAERAEHLGFSIDVWRPDGHRHFRLTSPSGRMIHLKNAGELDIFLDGVNSGMALATLSKKDWAELKGANNEQ